MVEQIKAPEVTEASKEKQAETPKQIFDKAFDKIKDKPLVYTDAGTTINISAKGIVGGGREISITKRSEGGDVDSQIVTIDKTGAYSARFIGVIGGQSMAFPLESGNTLASDEKPTVGLVMDAIDRGFQINTEKNLATIKQKENLTKKTESPDEKLKKDLASL